MSNLRIPYESKDFPQSFAMNSCGELKASWSCLIWAALTVGRASWIDVWRHGSSSVYEVIFRCSLVKLALREGYPPGHLCLTDAFKNLDPSEKSAINYFVGMTICKLFAAKLLDTPWLLHLDVYRSALRPQLRNGSRPDLVGTKRGGFPRLWRSFECKGRLRSDRRTKDKAKTQACNLVSVASGSSRDACDLHVGTITYFRRGILHFYWCDPEPGSHDENSDIALTLPPDAWRYYYAPTVNAIMRAATPDPREQATDGHISSDQQKILMASEKELVPVDELDIRIGVHHAVAEYLAKGDWDGAQRMAAEMADEFAKMPDIRPDGLIVKAGPSWTRSGRGDIDFAP